MTSEKHLKARIRARMARTGERYTTARRHVVGDVPATTTDHGYALRGGLHPESAAVANLLAHHGVRGLSEAMVLGVGGGLGAGYILWEFSRHDSRILTLGFRRRWNYLDWTVTTLRRLGAEPAVHTTAGSGAAAAALDAGMPALVTPDRYHAGYWHLPGHLDGHGGHQVVAYAAGDDGRVHLDDRNLAPLTVDREVLARARGRVVSYRNHLVSVTGVTPVDLAAAARAGIAECVAHLGGTSASFALPAWAKWARLVTDTRNAKGWPRVFADGRGLAGALLSAWEGTEPVGADGGHLRGLYADFLDEAAPLIGVPLAGAAAAFRAAGEAWHAVAEAALPADVPAYARMRELSAAVAAGVAAGDAGAADRAAAAAELWELRAEYDARPPVEPDFAALAARLRAAHAAEVTAVAELRHAA
ncbi:BtrH N-terminal domain-containing protein [Spirilliplanes yamanashiensis]|uniref:DUF4872 domain-containing protein n=1 Tax=Spirilliplanes yamanashiensis TaxID=42233 RepID=A0A8J4DLN8_9ACTN|nr:BtrH N-terminal domain-containing protein [Spirilliplanes yamanashiensis]MDP9816652.1 hypothetical protein [Spirilliplanes yamanashiensis]GIJ06176.1 hypothetical protein Sya03_55280 [Spirilliplanes yamanashiensis]